MNGKKIMYLGMAGVMMGSFLTGCGSGEESSSQNSNVQSTSTGSVSTASNSQAASDSGEKIKVGFIVQDLTINYFLNVVRGVEDMQDQYNMEVQVIDGQSDATTQVTAMENLITQGVDCIVICPVDTVAPEAAVKQAQDAGIPVITWSEKIEGCNAWVAVDNYEYGMENGKIAGQWILDNLDSQEDAKVMYVYVQENEQLIERGKGMMDGVASLAPNAETVAIQSGNTTEAGMEAVETTLAKYPDLNVIVCSNDSVALGAYEAMVAAGKGEDKVCITGQDADQKNLEYIAEGTILKGTVDLDAYGQGELLCKTVQQVLDEGTIEDPIYVSFRPVTEDNVDEVLEEYNSNGGN